jgi:hypothetical protein
MTDPIHQATDEATDEAEVPTAAPIPGEPAAPAPRRALDRAPGERFTRGRGAALDALEAAGGGTPGRAVAMGGAGAVVGVVVFLVLAIPFTFTAGLVVAAIFMARLVGLLVRAGAGGSLSSPARVVAAVVVVLGGLAVANVALWLWALAEGGVLPLPQYLDEAYGTPLIALQFMLGTLTAWWSAR